MRENGQGQEVETERKQVMEKNYKCRGMIWREEKTEQVTSGDNKCARL